MKLPDVKDIVYFFDYHRICVLKVFMLLVQKVIEERTCCLYKCADAIEGNTQYESKYKRLLRFFTIKCSLTFCLNVGYLIISIILSFPFLSSDIYLAMDRTNWKIGKNNINPLFIGLILPDGVFVPLIWVPLDKRGNSNQNERIELLQTFLDLWTLQNADKKMILLADREFIGDKWIAWLKGKGFSFVIRLRENMYYDLLSNALGKKKSKMETYICRQIKKHGYLVTTIQILGYNLYYVAVPNRKENSKEKYLCFITDSNDVEWVKQAYDRRWKIEVFFKNIKTNGFNLEDMNLTEMDKIRLMMSIVSLAYILCLKEGIIQNQKRKIPEKKDKKTNKTWKSVSFFRYGFRQLKPNFKELANMIEYIIQQIDTNIKVNQKLIKKSTIPKLKSVQ